MDKKHIKLLSGLGVGSLLGFAYYYFIGCASGACAITSNPYISTAYGAMIGTVFMWPEKKKHEESEKENNDQSA
jgi:hypothetical protein